MQDFALILEQAGGAAAPAAHAAHLRAALLDELERGAAELALSRSGYGSPVVAAFASGAVFLPVPAALRADPLAVPERAWLLAAAGVGALVEAGGVGIMAGDAAGHLTLVADGAEAELAALAFDEQVGRIDRLRARGLAMPWILAAEDVRVPVNPGFAVAETVARRGGNPADVETVEQLAEEVPVRPHDDPDPSLRATRRILQRLRGMGKWGGYHTEFVHLARGFAGHERARALEVGEALLAGGLLVEKQSVGQRHVFLNPRRAADIHALVDDGRTPPGLALP